jgi:hypothetical protein
LVTSNVMAVRTIRRCIGAALSDREKQARWRKSSYSNTGDCLEWRIDSDRVRLRDSTRRSSGELHLSHSQWRTFLAAVKAGDADLPDGPRP